MNQSNQSNIRPLIGLLGVLVAALSADLNEFVSGAALVDVRGANGVSADPGLWIDSLYVTGTAIGMAFAPWCAVTFTLRRFTLFAIGLACAATTLLAVAPNLQTVMILRLIQGLSGGLTIPLLMTTALRVLPPSRRPSRPGLPTLWPHQGAKSAVSQTCVRRLAIDGLN